MLWSLPAPLMLDVEEPVAEGAHQDLRIGGRVRQERTAGKEKAVGNQTMHVGMEAPEIIAIGLNRRDHPGKGLFVHGRCLRVW